MSYSKFNYLNTLTQLPFTFGFGNLCTPNKWESILIGEEMTKLKLMCYDKFNYINTVTRTYCMVYFEVSCKRYFYMDSSLFLTES